jgi:hypothetical protein
MTVTENYITALDFIKSNPDYSLLKFREIVSEIVKLVSKKNGIVFENEKLFDNIDELFNSQLIHHSLYENLHKVRKLGNTGAHVLQFFEGAKEFQKTRKKTLLENAHQARKAVLSILEDVFCILKNEKLVGKIELSPEGQQDHREALYDACVSRDPKLKLKAGIICETILLEQFLEADLRYSSSRQAHFNQLAYTAMNFYNASCEISANIDKNNPYNHEDIEPFIQKYADAEALYKFVGLAIGEPPESEYYQKAIVRLKALADRGYSPAEALYGATLYENEEYEESYKYLELGSKKAEPVALNTLYLMFSEGNGFEVDYKKAKFFLDQALELEDPDAFAYLGMAYREGKVFSQNMEEGMAFLQKSVDMGSVMGRRNQQVAELAENMSNGFEDIFARIQEGVKDMVKKPITNESKVGRNDQCPCDSGKKYKKCCGKNT